jgi:hypothetical protein
MGDFPRKSDEPHPASIIDWLLKQRPGLPD